MISKCECMHCAKPIEFDAAQLEKAGETPYRVLGQFITCPHCGQSTQLYIPRHAIAKPSLGAKPKTNTFKIWYIFISILLAATGGILADNGFFGNDDDAFALILGAFNLPIYFVPSVVGMEKENKLAIFILNLCLGWTVLGWVAALVWAVMKEKNNPKTP